MDADTRVLIGIVGFTPVLDCYPLGPGLMSKLEASTWPGSATTIENMSWGPLAIVQSLQASGACYDRAILIGAAQRGRPVGTVRGGVWRGGALDPQLLQERIFEAVTGIVSLDNLLIIGEHFAVWPREVITVEVELPRSCFGDLVVATDGGRGGAGDAEIEARLSFRPSGVVDRIVAFTRRAAVEGVAPRLELEPRSAETLMPAEAFWRTDVAAISESGR